MPGKTTLAAAVMAALSVSTLIAQSASPARPSYRYATVDETQPLPPVMHFCAQHCATFTLENGRYVLSAGGANNGSFIVMTIEKFTHESVVIHRTDTGNFPGTALYTGRMSVDGSSLSGEGWKITWGTALNSIPGSDEERAKRQQPAQAAGPASPSPVQNARKGPSPAAPYFPQMSEPSPAMETVKIDLNGDWQGYFDGPMFPKAIRITQTGDKITAEDLFYQQLTPVGRPFFRGTRSGTGSHFQVELAVFSGIIGMSSNVPERWQPAPVVIGDPDHFRIGNHPPFERMRRPPANDVPCDVENKFHTYAKGAFVRGNMQLELKNYGQAACWYLIGSKLGSADAVSNLGYLYEHGLGVQQDYGMALKLYQASAEKGSIIAAHNAAHMYANGVGVPKDPEKAQMWRSKEAGLRTQQRAGAIRDQQQEQGLELIGLLGQVAASVVSHIGLDSPLCNQDPSTNTAQEIERKQDQLRDEGMTCEDGALVPIKK